MLTDVGCSVRVPVLSLLFSDSLIAVTLRTTAEPAGMTTRPVLSLISSAIVAVTVSPTLFLLDRTSAVVVAVSLVPAARLAVLAGVEGAADDVLGAEVLGLGLVGVGRIGCEGVRVAVLGVAVEAAVSLGRSFNAAVVSTGASCRSGLRLSAAAVSVRSPRLQAAIAAIVSAAMIVLDI